MQFGYSSQAFGPTRPSASSALVFLKVSLGQGAVSPSVQWDTNGHPSKSLGSDVLGDRHERAVVFAKPLCASGTVEGPRDPGTNSPWPQLSTRRETPGLPTALRLWG